MGCSYYYCSNNDYSRRITEVKQRRKIENKCMNGNEASLWMKLQCLVEMNSGYKSINIQHYSQS